MSRLPNTGMEKRSYAASPASKIKTAPAGPDTNVVEHDFRVVRQRRCLRF
jgi:hypothetical protein